MPVGNLSVEQALHLLTTHARMYSNQPILTHRLDREGVLCRHQHHCFNGAKVLDVLIFDARDTFVPTIEARAILERVMYQMEWRRDFSSPEYFSGYASASNLQNAIEVALYKLEKSTIKEARPEVVKQEN